MTTRGLHLLQATAVFLTTACGTNRPTIPDELLHDDSGAGGGNYPAGPYAKSEKDLGLPVKDLTFARGWTDPKGQGYDTKELAPISIHDFYDPDGTKGYSILILNTSAVWCGACKNEHGGTGSTPSLAERIDALGPKGLVILSALFQDAKYNPATESNLKTWAEQFETNFPFVLDPEYQLGSTYGVPANVAPLNLMVDARTMKLLAGTTGDTLDWTAVEAKLDALAK